MGGRIEWIGGVSYINWFEDLEIVNKRANKGISFITSGGIAHLDEQGRFGIGTADPHAPLDVYGDIYARGNVSVKNNDLHVSYGNVSIVAGEFYDNYLRAVNSGATVYYDTGTGQFGQAPGSSHRYKENIEDLDLGLTTVMNLHPVYFDYKESYLADSPRQIGLIAEDVAEESALLAVEVNGQTESVKYDRLNAVLIKAIQEQKVYLEALEQRIEQMEQKIN